jgi:hypothetical protein
MGEFLTMPAFLEHIHSGTPEEAELALYVVRVNDLREAKGLEPYEVEVGGAR